MHKIMGAAFVNFTVAFDTVHHQLLLQKLYHFTKDCGLTEMVAILLQNQILMNLMNLKGRHIKGRHIEGDKSKGRSPTG